MRSKCYICYDVPPKHVLRFHMANEKFFELDVCDECRDDLKARAFIFRRVDGV